MSKDTVSSFMKEGNVGNAIILADSFKDSRRVIAIRTIFCDCIDKGLTDWALVVIADLFEESNRLEGRKVVLGEWIKEKLFGPAIKMAKSFEEPSRSEGLEAIYKGCIKVKSYVWAQKAREALAS